MNLKASDLRIGNLVNVANEICKITCVSEEGISADSETNSYVFEEFEDINQIELTEEILFKSGFERIEKIMDGPIGDLLISYENDGYEFMQDILGGWFLCGYSWNTKHFRFVHDLQNIYYCLSGEELIINI